MMNEEERQLRITTHAAQIYNLMVPGEQIDFVFDIQPNILVPGAQKKRGLLSVFRPSRRIGRTQSASMSSQPVDQEEPGAPGEGARGAER